MEVRPLDQEEGNNSRGKNILNYSWMINNFTSCKKKVSLLKNKAGYTATLFACGSAGTVLNKVYQAFWGIDGESVQIHPMSLERQLDASST